MNKVVLVSSIRPDTIRISLIIEELKKYFQLVLVSVGQHYDENLDKIQYQQLRIHVPNYILNPAKEPKEKQIGEVIIQFSKVLQDEKPEFVVILGDNDGSMACSIATVKLKIPLVHLESGHRSMCWDMQEERNRRIIDHIADLNLCYLHSHKDNLIREGISPSNIFVIGNPMIDIVRKWENEVKPPKYKNYMLVTLHRGETVDDGDLLNEIICAIGQLNIPTLMVLMPRTKKSLQKFHLSLPDNVTAIDPQGYLDFLALEKHADIVLTDSGSCPEECYILGVPCVTIRNTTERTDLIEMGVNVLAGIDRDKIINAVNFALQTQSKLQEQNPEFHYGQNVAHKVTNILLSNWQFWEKR